MQQLKNILMTLALSTVGLIMLIVGLGVTLFVFFVLVVMSLFVKSKSHAQMKQEYKEKWKDHFKNHNDNKKTRNNSQPDVIEGQYEIVDN